MAPTIRYSTLFEFKHSMNSRKSLFKGIGISSFAESKEDVNSLLGTHLSTGFCIRGIRCLKAFEDPNLFLHASFVILS